MFRYCLVEGLYFFFIRKRTKVLHQIERTEYFCYSFGLESSGKKEAEKLNYRKKKTNLGQLTIKKCFMDNIKNYV